MGWLDQMHLECLGNVHLILGKPPLTTPNRLASPDLGRFSCDSANVVCETENDLFHIYWMVLLQISEPEHPSISEAEKVVGVCRFFQQEFKEF